MKLKQWCLGLSMSLATIFTQAQADAKIEWMQKRIDAGFEKGFAGHGGPGMGGKGPGQGPRF